MAPLHAYCVVLLIFYLLFVYLCYVKSSGNRDCWHFGKKFICFRLICRLLCTPLVYVLLEVIDHDSYLVLISKFIVVICTELMIICFAQGHRQEGRQTRDIPATPLCAFVVININTSMKPSCGILCHLTLWQWPAMIVKDDCSEIVD